MALCNAEPYSDLTETGTCKKYEELIQDFHTFQVTDITNEKLDYFGQWWIVVENQIARNSVLNVTYGSLENKKIHHTVKT